MTKSLREKLQAIQDGEEEEVPIVKTLGMKVLKFGNDGATIKMRVDKRFYNPMGTLHGGIMTDLADACMGVAAMSLLDEGESVTTLELKINFIRPVYEGEITAESKVFHKGKTITLTECVITNDDRKEVARAIATQMILQKPQIVTKKEKEKERIVSP